VSAPERISTCYGCIAAVFIVCLSVVWQGCTELTNATKKADTVSLIKGLEFSVLGDFNIDKKIAGQYPAI